MNSSVKRFKKPAPVHAGQRVGEAFGTILNHNLGLLAEAEPLARSWDDIEGVHQLRVTLRRMRSALTVFRSAIPKQLTAQWSEEMRWAGGELGLARDLDVFIDEGLGPVHGKLNLKGEDKLVAIAERHRALAYERVGRMLDSERYARFKEEFAAWLGREGWREGDLKPKIRDRQDAPVVTFGRKILDKHERRVLEAGAHVDPNDAPAMHQLRIECKKLRYTAEFLTPVFAGMQDFIKEMKGLQDLLGVMNDVAVMHQLFEHLLQGVADPEVLEFAGGLIGWRACGFEHLKGSFDGRWDEFVHAKHPWWKKSAVLLPAD